VGRAARVSLEGAAASPGDGLMGAVVAAVGVDVRVVGCGGGPVVGGNTVGWRGGRGAASAVGGRRAAGGAGGGGFRRSGGSQRSVQRSRRPSGVVEAREVCRGARGQVAHGGAGVEA
jgi:hypothetical protein